MSSVAIPSNQIYLGVIRQFQQETKQVLKKYIFKSSHLDYGCRVVQKFAKKAIKLQEVEQQLKSGCSDWKVAQRTWAAIQCLGSALLFAATVALVAAVVIPLLPAGFNAKHAAIFTLLGVPIIASLGLLNRTLTRTAELFETHSPKWLETRLQELAKSKPTQGHLQELVLVMRQLEKRKAKFSPSETHQIDAAIQDIRAVLSGLTAIPQSFM